MSKPAILSICLLLVAAMGWAQEFAPPAPDHFPYEYPNTADVYPAGHDPYRYPTTGDYPAFSEPAYAPYPAVAQMPYSLPAAPLPAPEIVAPLETPAPPAKAASWFDASYWLPPDDWDANFELGINGQTGNTESMSIRTGGKVEHKTASNEFLTSLTYARTYANSLETQHNALLRMRNESLFAESPWTLFGQYLLEYDEFKAFDFRWVVNGGVGYQIVKSEGLTVTGRFGAGVSREIGGPEDEYKPEALFGLEYRHKFNKRHSLSAKSEYMPAWNDFEDFRMVNDIGWVISLDDVDALSLKVGLIERYDSTPNGRERSDLDYSILLLWKL